MFAVGVEVDVCSWSSPCVVWSCKTKAKVTLLVRVLVLVLELVILTSIRISGREY